MAGPLSALAAVARNVMSAVQPDTVTYRRVARGAFDVASGSTAADTATDYTLLAVVEGTAQRELPDLVKAGALDVTFAAQSLPVTPAMTDRVVIAGDVFGIVTISPVRAGAAVVLYKLTVVRGS